MANFFGFGAFSTPVGQMIGKFCVAELPFQTGHPVGSSVVTDSYIYIIILLCLRT